MPTMILTTKAINQNHHGIFKIYNFSEIKLIKLHILWLNKWEWYHVFILSVNFIKRIQLDFYLSSIDSFLSIHIFYCFFSSYRNQLEKRIKLKTHLHTTLGAAKTKVFAANRKERSRYILIPSILLYMLINLLLF